MDAYIHQMEEGKERASANQPDEGCMWVFRKHTLF